MTSKRPRPRSSSTVTRRGAFSRTASSVDRRGVAVEPSESRRTRGKKAQAQARRSAIRLSLSVLRARRRRPSPAAFHHMGAAVAARNDQPDRPGRHHRQEHGGADRGEPRAAATADARPSTSRSTSRSTAPDRLRPTRAMRRQSSAGSAMSSPIRSFDRPLRAGDATFRGGAGTATQPRHLLQVFPLDMVQAERDAAPRQVVRPARDRPPAPAACPPETPPDPPVRHNRRSRPIPGNGAAAAPAAAAGRPAPRWWPAIPSPRPASRRPPYPTGRLDEHLLDQSSTSV